MRLTVLFLSLVLIAACSNNPKLADKNNNQNTVENGTAKTRPEEKGANILNVSGCYWKISNHDTIGLHLNQTGDSINGRLTFDNYQMDGSSGLASGTVEGNIIKLWYRFSAEGMNSVTEIYFKKEGSNLLRGSAQYRASGDSSFYENKANITYNLEDPFLMVLCDSFPIKFKLKKRFKKGGSKV